ncbi:MAG: type II toxin-antitoxin system HicB family antitoxin [Verrucomicrobiaceae bacterium]|nr:MAG: type II toxin-antitoxin system HicB family antitoxin [Verrucomicrobiaceae bacterium]
MRYKLIIEWSETDRSLVVEVPELPGCMADGGTYEEAVVNAQTVIQKWVETAQSLRRLIPEAKGRLAYA